MQKALIALAFLSALAFIIVTPIVVSLVNMQQVLADPDAVKEALAGETLIDEAVAVIIRQDIRELPLIGDLPLVIKGSKDLESALDILVPEDWANSQSDKVVDSMFLYFDSGDFDDLSFVIDLRPFFNDLRGEPGRELVRSTLESLPSCGLDNLPQFDLETGEIEIIACMPPLVPVGFIADQLHGLISQLLNEQVAALLLDETLEFNLLDLDPAPRPDSERKLERVRLFYRISRAGAPLLWLLPLGFLTLTIALAVRSVRSFGLWLGGALLIAFTLSFLMALFVRSLLPTLLLDSAESVAANDIPGAIINGILRSILAVLLEKWQARVFLQSGIAFVVGILLAGIGLAALLVRTIRKQEPN